MPNFTHSVSLLVSYVQSSLFQCHMCVGFYPLPLSYVISSLFQYHLHGILLSAGVSYIVFFRERLIGSLCHLVLPH